jgi:adenylate kinase family enzyme
VRRVAVIGCGGAGKTTLARELARRLDVPVVHGDTLRAEWEWVQPALLREEAWVIDAMRLASLAPRLEAADTVVFLDRRTLACLTGIARRGSLGELLRNREFLLWVLRFRRRHRPRIVALLERYRSTTDVVVLRSRAEVRAFVASC